MNQLFNEYYNIEEPTYGLHDDYMDLKKRLKKANVLNVNINVNESNKIKREGNGTGARLETKMNPMDENMV